MQNLRIVQDEQTFNAYKELLKDNAAVIYLKDAGGEKAPVTSFDGIKEFANLTAAEELNNYNVMGAVLSYNGEKFIVWNGNKTTNTWDWDAVAVDDSNTTSASGLVYATVFEQTVPTTYGTPIAICVGNGMWVVINNGGDDTTAELYNQYKWANDETNTMHTSVITEGFKKRGAEICKEIYKRVDLSDSELFTFANSIRPVGVTDCRCYVPSMQQQMNIITDVHRGEDYADKTNVLCNVIKYGANYYWTASQHLGAANNANNANNNGNINNNYKSNSNYCFFCLLYGL